MLTGDTKYLWAESRLYWCVKTGHGVLQGKTANYSFQQLKQTSGTPLEFLEKRSFANQFYEICS